MLHAHPAICCLPETAFVRRFLASGLLSRVHQQDGAPGVAQFLLDDERFGRLKLSDEAVRALVPTQQQDLPVLYPRIMGLFAEDKGNPSILGDKDPRNAEYLPWIQRHYPEAYVLHIYRDPRDVLLSKKKAAWSRGRSLFYHSFAGRVQFQLAQARGRQLFGERYHEICYEQLIAQPTQVLKGVCAHLGIDYDPAMESFGKAGSDLASSQEMAWKKETLGPLLSQNRDKWRKGLEPFEIAVTQKVCKRVMHTGAYAAEPQQVSLARRLLLLGLPLPFFVAGTLYGVYRQWKQRT